MAPKGGAVGKTSDGCGAGKPSTSSGGCLGRKKLYPRKIQSIEVFWVPGSYDDALGFEVWRCILLKSVEVCAFEGCPNDITVLNISKVGMGLTRGCFPSCAGK